MTKSFKNKKAFTLTELIVVIAVIGILAAVLIPSLTGYISKAKESAAKQEAASVYQVYEAWSMEADEGSFGNKLLDGTKTENNVTKYDYSENSSWDLNKTTKSFAFYYATSVNKTIDYSSVEPTTWTVGNVEIIKVTGKTSLVIKASNQRYVKIEVLTDSVKYTVSQTNFSD